MSAPSSLFSICCLLLLLLIPGCGESKDPPGGNIGESVSANFEVMRGPSERLPVPLAKHVTRILSRPKGAIPINTQLVKTGEDRVWVFRYGPKLCLAQAETGSAACAGLPLARSRGVVLGTFSPPSIAVPRLHGFLVVGVMPDDVGSIKATIGRQSHKRYIEVPVRGNVFAISAERPILVRGVHRH